MKNKGSVLIGFVAVIIIIATTVMSLAIKNANYLLPTKVVQGELKFNNICEEIEVIEKKWHTSLFNQYACMQVLAEDGFHIGQEVCFRQIWEEGTCKLLEIYNETSNLGKIAVIQVIPQTEWIVGDSTGTPEQKQDILDLLQ